MNVTFNPYNILSGIIYGLIESGALSDIIEFFVHTHITFVYSYILFIRITRLPEAREIHFFFWRLENSIIFHIFMPETTHTPFSSTQLYIYLLHIIVVNACMCSCAAAPMMKFDVEKPLCMQINFRNPIEFPPHPSDNKPFFSILFTRFY